MVHSFVGEYSDHRLVLGTVDNVNVFELADVVQQLGIVDAVAMDSGASSGLYATSPGREIATAIVVKKRTDQPIFNLNPGIQVKIDGKLQSYDQAPILLNDHTLVPLRNIFESIGCQVAWDQETQTAIATKGNSTITLQIGATTVTKNGQSMNLDVPAQLVNDHTMVPVRFVSEALGAKVDWDNATQTVLIATK